MWTTDSDDDGKVADCEMPRPMDGSRGGQIERLAMLFEQPPHLGGRHAIVGVVAKRDGLAGCRTVCRLVADGSHE